MWRYACLALLVLVLTGCAEVRGNYGCAGYPDGVACRSAREVYAMTEHSENLHAADQQKTDQVAFQPNAIPSAAQTVVRQFNPDDPIPIRMPEKVMRIWVAPWEDRQGSLHMTGLIYTEIEERRWVVGEKATQASPRLTPLDVRSREIKKTSQSRPQDLSEMAITLP